MKKGFVLIISFLMIILEVFTVYATNEDSVSVSFTDTLFAKSAVLLDADSGRVLYDKNGEEILPMASTTKIMTLIVALENAKPDEVITFSKYAASMPDVQLNALAGEQFILKDILYSLMLESHNDSAVAIAENIGSGAYNQGSVTKDTPKEDSINYVNAFIDLMNQKARDIGCFHTYFVTPNGLDATVTLEDGSVKTHSTTAKDLAAIMAYCMNESPKKEQFLEITGTSNHNFNNILTKEDGSIEGGSRSFSCNNHNAFLNMMDGAISGKTGFTNDAGYCYVGALKKDEKTLVVALLACGWPNHKNYKWSDTKKLMQYGLDNYQFVSFEDLAVDETRFEPILVHNGQTRQLFQKAYAGVRVLSQEENEPKGLLLRKDEKIEVKYEIQNELEAPVLVGQQVGSIKYMLDGEVWKSKKVVLTDEVEKIDYTWCFRKIWEQFSM